MVIDSDRLILLDDDMSFVTAAFQAAYGISYYALKQWAEMKVGETLLVLDADGFGFGFGFGLAQVNNRDIER